MPADPLTDESILASSAAVPKHVVYRAFAHETVLLNLEAGRYHGVNPVGGRMLETLERSGTVAEAAAYLADEFARPRGEIERDVCAFCRDLHERGLIELSRDDR